MLYNTDSTTVQYSYDAAGRVVTRRDRNGDVTRFEYDADNRVVSVQRNLGGSFSSSTSWYQVHTYDAVGNRIEFDNGFTTSSVYDTSLFDTDEFVVPALSIGRWPRGWLRQHGSADRVQSPTQQQHQLQRYDVEGRCVEIDFSNGGTPPVTSLVYDLIGRLQSMDTAEGATDLLPLGCYS